MQKKIINHLIQILPLLTLGGLMYGWMSNLIYFDNNNSHFNFDFMWFLIILMLASLLYTVVYLLGIFTASITKDELHIPWKIRFAVHVVAIVVSANMHYGSFVNDNSSSDLPLILTGMLGLLDVGFSINAQNEDEKKEIKILD